MHAEKEKDDKADVGITIAPMTAEDLDGVLEIEQVSFPRPWSRRQFTNELNNPVSNAYVIRLAPDGIVAGYTVFWIIQGEGHILNIAVRGECRRRGLGNRLLSHCLRVMMLNNVFEVFLEVRRSNDVAKGLYRAFGFKEIAERKNYYGDEDAIVMKLAFW